MISIFSSFLSNKLVTFNDCEPLWMNDYVKSEIKWKHQIDKTYEKMVA